MSPRYQPRRLEAKWQEIWQAQRLYEASEDPGRSKYYVLEMFP
jgi:leucyl-tRNA synthetase